MLNRFVALTSLLLCSALLLLSIRGEAAEPGYRFVWVRTMLGPCCGDAGHDLVVDADGGVLVAGHRGGLDLDRDGSVDVQTFGSPDPLIFKEYDRRDEGWVMGPGGPKPDSASGIAADRQGGAYAVGHFEETMKIASSEITSAGKRDGFLVRYGLAENTRWARPLGGIENDSLFDVASDSSGNAYVIGTVRGEVDLDRDGTIDVTATGESSMLLASFDPKGRLRWAGVSTGQAAEHGRTITISPEGELYVGGYYLKGALDLDGDGTADGPPTATLDPNEPVTSNTDMNGFFARFDLCGEMLWARTAAGPKHQGVGSLVVAGNGDLLVLGGYTASTDLDGDRVPDIEFKSLGQERIAKYHEDGNVFLLRSSPDGEILWVRRYAAMASHVTADASRIVLSGTYSGPLDLDDDGQVERPADSDPQQEGFAAILDGKGNLLHVFTVVGGNTDVVSAAGFTLDGKKLYITGYTKLGADFDDDDKPESASACHQLGDVYLAQYEVED